LANFDAPGRRRRKLRRRSALEREISALSDEAWQIGKDVLMLAGGRKKVDEVTAAEKSGCIALPSVGH
jgi:hypothetical protein